MITGVFLFYFLLLIFLFSSPEKWRKQDRRLKRLFLIPAIIALVMTLLSVIKVYFIYKIFILLFAAFTCLLSYWQWGEQLRQWWKR